MLNMMDVTILTSFNLKAIHYDLLKLLLLVSCM